MRMIYLFGITCLLCGIIGNVAVGSGFPRPGGSGGAIGEEDRFAPLGAELPTPNRYRTASGAPGTDYWQQRADYKIDVELDEENNRIVGSAVINYFNRSPDVLRYLWLHLDANLLTPESTGSMSETAPNFNAINHDHLRMLFANRIFDGGMRIRSVQDAMGDPLPYTVVDTLMRIDLPEPLASGANIIFAIKWDFLVVHHKDAWARKGYEPFDEGGAIYQIAQWFPRMAAYTDYVGWQTKPFLGWGEFTLEFGDYLVRITVPDNHLVAATGELLNSDEVLTDSQRDRLTKAETADAPMFIVTPEEALNNDRSESTGKKTWVFHAEMFGISLSPPLVALFGTHGESMSRAIP